MIINYTFFHKLHTNFFFTSFGKKSPRDKNKIQKAKIVKLKCQKTSSINTKTKNPQQQKQAQDDCTQILLGSEACNWIWITVIILTFFQKPRQLSSDCPLFEGMIIRQSSVSWATSAVRLARSMRRSLLIKVSKFQQEEYHGHCWGTSLGSFFLQWWTGPRGVSSSRCLDWASGALPFGLITNPTSVVS